MQSVSKKVVYIAFYQLMANIMRRCVAFCHRKEKRSHNKIYSDITTLSLSILCDLELLPPTVLQHDCTLNSCEQTLAIVLC